jgi:hypothetical protein
MIQQRHARESKQPLRIVNGVDSPGDVVDAGRDENQAMKFASPYQQRNYERTVCRPSMTSGVMR